MGDAQVNKPCYLKFSQIQIAVVSAGQNQNELLVLSMFDHMTGGHHYLRAMGCRPLEPK